MIKEVLQSADQYLMAALGTTALLLFVAIFIGAVIYAWTRPRRQVDEWAQIPLTSGEEPHSSEHRP